MFYMLLILNNRQGNETLKLYPQGVRGGRGYFFLVNRCGAGRSLRDCSGERGRDFHPCGDFFHGFSIPIVRR